MVFQKNCVIPETYNCISEGDCQDPGDGSGQYLSLTDCLSSCVSTSNNQIFHELQLLKITDIFGRETKEKSNTTLFYIYENGKVEKKIILK